MSAWKLLSARASLFSIIPVPQHTASELYTEILGAPPDSTQQTRSNPLMPTNAQGAFGDAYAVFSTQPGRIDFSFNPNGQAAPAGDAALILIENSSFVMAQINRIIDAIERGAVSGDASRVALFLHFAVPQTNSREANDALAAVIPERYGVAFGDDEDVVFQANRRAPSRRVEGWTLNAVVKWSVDLFQLITVPQMPMAGVFNPFEMMPVSRIVSSVTFDINNVPSAQNQALNAAQQAMMLRDALELALERVREFGMEVHGL